MGEVSALHHARRALFTDERGAGMRVTWHSDRELVVLSLWRGDTCVGTFRMGPSEAARLAGFITDHLGRQLESRTPAAADEPGTGPASSPGRAP